MKENKKNEMETDIIQKSEIRTNLRDKVYQTNPLIQARKQMGTIELKIFILGLRGVNPHISLKDKFYDEKFWTTNIPPSKIVEIFGHPQYLIEIGKVCRNLIKTYIEIKEEKEVEEGKKGKKGFKLFNVFHRLRYVNDEGLYVQFHEDMRPYILDIYKAKGYTQYSTEQVFKLSSAYAIRLCELLLQFQGIKGTVISRTIRIEDLKFALNVSEEAYERTANFKMRVLDDPIREINKKTDYIITYDQIKQGRSITAFIFTMDISKVKEKEKMQQAGSQELLAFEKTVVAKKIIKLGFTLETAKKLLSKCENSQDLLKRLDFAIKMYERNSFAVKNKQGYIRRGIEENWLASYLKEKKNKRLTDGDSEGDIMEL